MIKMFISLGAYILIGCIFTGLLTAILGEPEDEFTIGITSLFWPVIVIAFCIAAILWFFEWLSRRFGSFFEGFLHSFRKDK